MSKIIVMTLCFFSWPALACVEELELVQPAALARELVQTYQLLPAPFKKIMCGTKFELENMPYSAINEEQGKRIAFRSSLFADDAPVPLDVWATWKEQLNFGAENSDEFPVSSDLPRASLEYPGRVVSGFEFLLIHELGHTVSAQVQMDWKTFGYLLKQAKAQLFSAFGKVIEFCFYWCEAGGLAVSQNLEHRDMIYSTINSKGLFPTLYSYRHNGEAFAEIFALIMSEKYFGLKSYRILLPNGDVALNTLGVLHSPLFQARYQMVEEALEKFAQGEKISRESKLPPGKHQNTSSEYSTGSFTPQD